MTDLLADHLALAVRVAGDVELTIASMALGETWLVDGAMVGIAAALTERRRLCWWVS